MNRRHLSGINEASFMSLGSLFLRSEKASNISILSTAGSTISTLSAARSTTNTVSCSSFDDETTSTNITAASITFDDEKHPNHPPFIDDTLCADETLKMSQLSCLLVRTEYENISTSSISTLSTAGHIIHGSTASTGVDDEKASIISLLSTVASTATLSTAGSNSSSISLLSTAGETTPSTNTFDDEDTSTNITTITLPFIDDSFCWDLPYLPAAKAGYSTASSVATFIYSFFSVTLGFFLSLSGFHFCVVPFLFGVALFGFLLFYVIGFLRVCLCDVAYLNTYRCSISLLKTYCVFCV